MEYPLICGPLGRSLLSFLAALCSLGHNFKLSNKTHLLDCGAARPQEALIPMAVAVLRISGLKENQKQRTGH